jgi:hypothetical protein
MFFALLTLTVALAISAVAAWYSIVGLMAIFAAAAIPIAIMGGVLEVGKLLTASWLYNNWRTAPFLLKSYLTAAVAILMLITSMGIFGFLSKAHIDQGIGGNNAEGKLERIDKKIRSEQKIVERSEALLETLDDALDRYIELGAISKGLDRREEQTAEREIASKAIAKAESIIDTLEDEKAELLSEVRAFEVEVGPIKYIADLIYENGEDNLDEAVRAVILLLIFVFDPLAVLLVIAGNMSLREAMGKPRKMVEVYNWKTDENVETEIDDDDEVGDTRLPETDTEDDKAKFEKTFGKNAIYQENKVFHGIKKKT